MGAKITLMGPEWISLDGSLPEVQKPCYFLDRENVFRGVMDEQGDVYEILDNGTNNVVYHSNIEDGYIAFWEQELKMIENMEDKDISDKTRMKGMNQGIWLAVPGDAGRERAPCRRVYVYGQDGEHDGHRSLYIKGRR